MPTIRVPNYRRRYRFTIDNLTRRPAASITNYLDALPTGLDRTRPSLQLRRGSQHLSTQSGNTPPLSLGNVLGQQMALRLPFSLPPLPLEWRKKVWGQNSVTSRRPVDEERERFQEDYRGLRALRAPRATAQIGTEASEWKGFTESAFANPPLLCWEKQSRKGLLVSAFVRGDDAEPPRFARA